MATVVARPENAAKVVLSLPGQRYDHVFFSTMAWLMLVTVFVGFAPSYYLAGVFRAPLPSLIIHVHGAAFTCWMLLPAELTFTAGLALAVSCSPAQW